MTHPRYGIVPFIRRDEVVESLEAWINDASPFSVTVLAGEGGAGKTRLAVELCESTVDSTWAAGFLRSEPEQAAMEALADTRANRLVVVDYAENRSKEARDVIVKLAAASTPEHRARVLLVMRHPHGSTSSGDRWLSVLRGQGAEFDSHLQDVDVLELDAAPISAGQHTRIAKLAAEEFAYALNLSVPAKLPQSEFEQTPLTAVLLAFGAVTGTTGLDSANAALDEILLHEQRYWVGRAEAASLTVASEHLARLVGLMTLTTPPDRPSALERLRLLTEFSDATNERVSSITSFAHDLYPGDAYWNPLEPDRIGERLVSRVFTDSEELKRIVEQSPGFRPLAVLARLDKAESPASEVTLSASMRSLDDMQLLRLSWGLEAGPAGDRLAGEIVELADHDTWDGERTLVAIAQDDARSFEVRTAALEKLLLTLREAYPFRRKDVTTNEPWSDYGGWVGMVLKALLETRREETIMLMVSWLGNTTRLVKHLDRISRHDIAIAVLLSIRMLDRGRLEDLSATSHDAFMSLIDAAAAERPQQIAEYLSAWAADESHVLNDGALSIAREAVRHGDRSDEVINALRRLASTEWKGQATALACLSGARPHDEVVAESVFAAVSSGDLGFYQLEPYFEIHPERVLDLMEAADTKERQGQLLHATNTWFPPDPEHEARKCALLWRLLALGTLASELAFTGEDALHHARNGGIVSTQMMDLLHRIMANETNVNRRPMFYALASPGRSADFDALRDDLLATLWSASPTNDELATLVIALYRNLDDAVDWPPEELTRSIFAQVTDEQAPDLALRIAVNGPDDAIKFISGLIASGDLPEDSKVGRFVTTYMETRNFGLAFDAAFDDL